jgi:hypothetical protein
MVSTGTASDVEIEAAVLALGSADFEHDGWASIERLVRDLRDKVRARHESGTPGRFPLAIASMRRTVPKLKQAVRALRPRANRSAEGKREFLSVTATLALTEDVVGMLAEMDAAAATRRDEFLARILKGISVPDPKDLPACTVSADALEKRLTKYLETHPFNAAESARWDAEWGAYRAALDADE